MNQNCLVTGGAGFIGSHLCRELIKAGHRVTVLDNFRAGNKENLKGLDLEVVQGDVRDLYTVDGLVKNSEVVYHLAAMTTNAESVRMLRDCISINTMGTVNVLDAAKSSGRCKVILSSDPPWVNQTNRKGIKTPLEVTKLDAESYTCLYREQWGVPTTIVRYDCVYGPGQSHHSPDAGVVPTFIIKALRNDPIQIIGDGSQTNDYVFVKDVVSGNLLANQSGDETYNLVSGEQVSLMELAVIIKSITNSRSPIQLLEEDYNQRRELLTKSDNLHVLGFKPQYPLKRGLEETIGYYDQLLTHQKSVVPIKV